jgi:hypothetical protein
MKLGWSRKPEQVITKDTVVTLSNGTGWSVQMTVERLTAIERASGCEPSFPIQEAEAD